MVQDNPIETPGTTAQLVVAATFMSFVFCLSALATFGWNNRAYIADLMYESNMEKYLVAIGESGPATFYVYHKDFSALDALARNSDEILGVELTKFPDVAAMAFTSPRVAAVDQVREHPLVSKMRRRNIPMLCH